MLERLQAAGLTIKLSKCHIADRRLKCLGHIVSAEGIAVDPDKIRAITELKPPQDGMKPAAKLKLVQSFVGFINYYRRHVDNFAMMARPLTQLSVKNAPFVWGEIQQESFKKLKKALLEAATLAHPCYDKPMELYPDACDYGIGCIMSQRIDGEERPLAYASRLLSKTECDYSISEKEMLALVWGVKKHRAFIWGLATTVYTDHQALIWLQTKKDLQGRLARWSLLLMECDLTVRYRSGKLQINADTLSRFPVEDPEREEIDEGDRFLAVMKPEPSILQEPTSTNIKEQIREGQRGCDFWKRVIDTLESGGS